MIILHLSDTHGLHHRIKDMPAADVIIQSHQGTGTCFTLLHNKSRRIKKLLQNLKLSEKVPIFAPR